MTAEVQSLHDKVTILYVIFNIIIFVIIYLTHFCSSARTGWDCLSALVGIMRDILVKASPHICISWSFMCCKWSKSMAKLRSSVDRVSYKRSHNFTFCGFVLLGVEKNNDQAKKNYFSSSKHDGASEILKTEARITQLHRGTAELQSCKRPKRSYTKGYVFQQFQHCNCFDDFFFLLHRVAWWYSPKPSKQTNKKNLKKYTNVQKHRINIPYY